MLQKALCVSFVGFIMIAALSATGNLPDDGPRAGKYSILSYGAPGRPPLPLGSFDLSGGNKYQMFLHGGKPAGAGTYRYDQAKHAVIWLTGPYVDQWGGDFTIERAGKTHSIRLKRGTYGTNSTD